MKILLDTHILLWALLDAERLSEKSRMLIADLDNEIYYSAASVWEIAIKHKKSPARVPFSSDQIAGFCDDAGYMCLNMTLWHAIETEGLRVKEGATVQNDPFDRMLIAQAKHENMPLLTRDGVMRYYDEPCVMFV